MERHIFAKKIASFEDLIKQLLIFTKAHPDWSLSKSTDEFNARFSSNLSDDEYHGLMFYKSEYAAKLKEKITKLKMRCPKCNSDEYHDPLFKEAGMVCFICGENYPLPADFDDEFPYNAEVETERIEYGLDNLERDKQERIKREKHWDDFVKKDIKKMNKRYEAMIKNENKQAKKITR